jgi:hypothetical protein
MQVGGSSVWKSELLNTYGGDPDSVIEQFLAGERNVPTLIAIIRILDDRLAFVENENKALTYKALTRASFTANGGLQPGTLPS